MQMTLSLADYGVGNLHSIKKALENAGGNVEVITDMADMLDADCIVFPGVGAFDKTMERLQPYREQICRRLDDGVPALGICIGAQIMFEGSDEGKNRGLGFIGGRVRKLETEQTPHMGWNSVESSDPLFGGIDNKFFYFAHSYYCDPSDRSAVVGTTEYEGFRIPAVFRKKNLYGFQFHPEKSSASGNILIRNFIRFAEERQ